jgi:hypothetical protein
MDNALSRSCAVEFPFGRLMRVKRHFSKWWDTVEYYPANRQPHALE